MSVMGPYGGAVEAWRRTLGELIDADADLRTLERVIETAGVDGETQSALWLWVWSRVDGRVARA